jgi:3-hydroxy acid dehydrogenase/malonic semialdehyde reductase
MSGETEFSTVRFSGDQAQADAVYAGMRPLVPADIAEAVYWVVSQPPHVNINAIEMMPVAQSFAPFQVHRG